MESRVVYCPFCNVDSGGNHEPDCPSHSDNSVIETQTWYNFG